MAYSQVPSDWIPSWSENGTDITVPIASFPLLSVQEADGATGDIRNIVLAFVDKIATKYFQTASADRPAKMTVSKSASYNASANTYTYTYNLTFVCSASDVAVVAEA